MKTANWRRRNSCWMPIYSSSELKKICSTTSVLRCHIGSTFRHTKGVVRWCKLTKSYQMSRQRTKEAKFWSQIQIWVQLRRGPAFAPQKPLTSSILKQEQSMIDSSKEGLRQLIIVEFSYLLKQMKLNRLFWHLEFNSLNQRQLI